MNQREKKNVGVRFTKCWSNQNLSESKRVPYGSVVNTPLPPHSGVHIFYSASIHFLQDWQTYSPFSETTNKMSTAPRIPRRSLDCPSCSLTAPLSQCLYQDWSNSGLCPHTAIKGGGDSMQINFFQGQWMPSYLPTIVSLHVLSLLYPRLQVFQLRISFSLQIAAGPSAQFNQLSWGPISTY